MNKVLTFDFFYVEIKNQTKKTNKKGGEIFFFFLTTKYAFGVVSEKDIFSSLLKMNFKFLMLMDRERIFTGLILCGYQVKSISFAFSCVK